MCTADVKITDGMGFLSELSATLKQHAGKVAVVKLEVSLVIEFEKGRRVWMVIFQVQVMNLWFCCCMATVFTNIHL